MNKSSSRSMFRVFAVICQLFTLLGSAVFTTPARAAMTFVNKTTANGLGNNMVRDVYVSGTTIYAATLGGGLSISTDGGATFTNKTTANGLGNNRAYNVYVSGTNVYVATEGGLSISTDGGGTFTNKTTANGLGNNATGNVYASGTTIYAATIGGLSISTDGGATFANRTTANGLGNNWVNGVFVDGSNVYAATNGGLSISADGGATFVNKTTADGLSALGDNTVNGVFASGSNVYAATQRGLSISTDGGGTFINKTTLNGLGNNFVYNAYASGSTVYAATWNGGLSISTDGGATFTNKTTADGLGHDIVYDIYVSSSNVYAATWGGLSFAALPDTTPPTVTSIIRASANPTSAASVDFTVTFSENVTGVDASDFSLTTTGGVSGAAVSGISGTGSTFTVTVDTGSGSGTIRLDVTDDDTIIDGASNPLGGAGLGNGNFTTGEAYGFNISAKDLTSFGFSSPVATGVLSGTNISVSVPYGTNVTALVANFTITGASVKVGATNQTSGVTANDFSAPVIYTVTAIDASIQNYTVTVSVQTWVNKTTLNGLGHNQVPDVFASGSNVYAATQYGLSISTDGGATFTNKTTANGLGHNYVGGVFISGSNVYAGTWGGLSISTDGGATFTNKTTLNGLGGNYVNDVFASGSNVYAATNGGLSISTDGGATFTNKTTANGLGHNYVGGVFISGSNVYAATLDGLSISTDGGATFVNKTTANGLGSNEVNGLFASGSNIYAATRGGLSISTDGGVSFTNRTTADGLGRNIVRGVYASGSNVYAATDSGVSISADGGATFVNYTPADGLGSYAVYGVHASGTYVYAATAGGLAFTALATPPTVTSIIRASANPTSAASVGFTVTFSETVTGVNATDFSLTTTGSVSGAAVSGVSGTGSTYTVTVNAGSGSGTIRLNVADDNSIVNAASTPLGGGAVGDGNFTGGETYITKPIAATSKWTDNFSYDQGWRTDLHPRVVGDVNGDGKDDLVGFGNGGIFVSLSNGTQFLPVSKWSGDYSYDLGWRTELHPRMVGDVNGDGKDDVVGYEGSGVWVALSDGTKFLPVSSWTSDFSDAQGWRVNLHPRVVGDVNGDGKDDLVGFGSGGIFVSLSNGTQFLPVSKWSGDYSYDQGWRIELHPRMVGDVNGDGKDDVVGYGTGGAWVALSDGSKFLAVSKWTSDFSDVQGWRADMHPRVVGDMNGDAKDDLIGFGSGGIWVALSDGAKFLPVSRWSVDHSYDQGWRTDLHPRLVGDVNGDLKEDVIGYGTSGTWIAISQ